MEPSIEDLETMTPYEIYINIRCLMLRQVCLTEDRSAVVWRLMWSLPSPCLTALLKLRKKIYLARETKKGKWDQVIAETSGYQADSESEGPTMEYCFERLRRSIHLGSYLTFSTDLKRQINKYVCSKFSVFKQQHLKDLIRFRHEHAQMDAPTGATL